MKNINPTKTFSWKSLKKHFNKIKDVKIKELFKKDNHRFKRFSLMLNKNLLLDYSKNIITKSTLKKLLNLAKEMDLKRAIHDMYLGKKINVTENRSVLHVALRNFNRKYFPLKDKKIFLYVRKMLKKMKLFSKNIISKKWLGYTGKYITDVVNVGIGGSYLGPLMTIKALSPFCNRLKIHFISNIDGTNVLEVLKKINFETTLFIICSKTFNTEETLTNAKTIKNFFLKKALNIDHMKQHFIGISENKKAVLKFGISEENFFKLKNWIGGRFSLWSVAGFSIVLSIGFKNFLFFLKGASDVDKHFLESPFKKNIPVLLSLLSIWYTNFFKSETEAIFSYNQSMSYFHDYLQQSCMESNGKNIDRNNNPVTWKTSPILWGSTGTNGQHSFFQLLHQGTKLVPCDFIAPLNNSNSLIDHHLKLLSNFFAQTRTLSFGNDDVTELHNKKKIKYEKKKNVNNIFKRCLGNQPNNSFLINEINPYSLGMLISLYEHKFFCQGVILNIYSFDQWGVENGKTISLNILSKLKSKKKCVEYDSSTNSLINFYKKKKL